jgi:hypothetical protein
MKQAMAAESMKVAIGFSTKDRCEQVKQVAARLLPSVGSKYDLFWFDGSNTPAGEELPTALERWAPRKITVYNNVRGGPDRAFVVAMTAMLKHPNNYNFIGYCEDDVLLEPDWFDRTMQLFEVGLRHGLQVGAVSARAYEDRVLIQRDGYAVMHNLGWGHVIFTRRAANLVLQHYRTGWTTENRRVFAQVCGKDIAPWWAFRGSEQWFCSDWGADAVLAQNGLASLALTPSICEMIGQRPALEEQGLRLVKRSVDLLRDNRVFERYRDTTAAIWAGKFRCNSRPQVFQMDLNVGGQIFFAHQLGLLRALWKGVWEAEWNLGFGPFAWISSPGLEWEGSSGNQLLVELAGPCDILMGGGKQGGSARVRDLASGYEVEPDLAAATAGAQMFSNVVVPANVAYRTIVVDKISPGVVIYGIKVRETQMIDPRWWFDADCLPDTAAESEKKSLTSLPV